MRRVLILLLFIIAVKSVEDAYVVPKKSQKTPQAHKAARVQNQSVRDIFEGIGEIICAAGVNCPRSQRCNNDNEVFRQCATACEPTCTNKNPSCTRQCLSPRCQCDQGFVRDSNFQCVVPSSCSNTQICTVTNEVFRQCATACEPTCQNQQPTCTRQCLSPRCQCDQGYVRSNGQCIPPWSCQSQTNFCPDPNQVFRQCATACEPTCDNQNPTCTRQCLSPRCQCDQGYVRSNGQCISPWTCPSQPTSCPGANQVFRQCATACEPTCDNQNPFCTFQCLSPRCQCDQGFVRNSQNQCVYPTSCFAQQTCPSNQIWNQCSTVCEPSCQITNPTCQSFVCGPPKCQCQQNFYRSSTAPNAPCVPWRQCGNTSPRPWNWWLGGRPRG